MIFFRDDYITLREAFHPIRVDGNSYSKKRLCRRTHVRSEPTGLQLCSKKKKKTRLRSLIEPVNSMRYFIDKVLLSAAQKNYIIQHNLCFSTPEFSRGRVTLDYFERAARKRRKHRRQRNSGPTGKLRRKQSGATFACECVCVNTGTLGSWGCSARGPLHGVRHTLLVVWIFFFARRVRGREPAARSEMPVGGSIILVSSLAFCRSPESG